MSGPLLILAAVAAFSVYGLIKTTGERLTHHGIHAGVWRFLTGQPWHGKPVTDAGWTRRGTRALTRTGHASKWQHLTIWERTAWRTGSVVALILTGYGLIVARGVTEMAWILGLVAAAAFGAWRAVRKFRHRRHRKTWLFPLHLALHHRIGYAVTDNPERWIQVEPDRSKATLALPPGFSASQRDQEAIATTVQARLGLEQPEVKWQLAGPSPTLMLKASHPPPTRVTFTDLRDAIEGARHDELVLGTGRSDSIVTVSLSGDSPHLALSMATGAGKSTTARLLGPQMLHQGGIMLVLDPKLTSLMWARGLPNVAYAGTPAEMHKALLWLEAEVDRRNAVALATTDIDGAVHGNVGPRLLVVAEEQNIAMVRLRKYWRAIREPGEPTRSPAIDAYESVLCAGRQVQVHVLAVAQMLSTRATGGGEARENMAAKILGRYSANAWKMLAPEHVMPPPSRVPGRVQVVTASVRETQLGYIAPREARDYALAGTVTPCPAGMPCVTAPPQRPELEEAPGDLHNVIDPAAPPDGAVTLQEARQAGILPGSIAAIRMLRHRHENFPAYVGVRDGAYVYDPVALASWQESRQS